MPRTKGRASTVPIDRIHAMTARAIDATRNQCSKDKILVPAAFIAQAIRFLEKTGSLEPARPTKRADRLADVLKSYDANEDLDGNGHNAATDFSWRD